MQRDTTLALLRAETERPERVDTHHGPVVAFASRRPSAGRPTEDSALVLPLDGALVLAVADGAGGHDRGGDASEIAISTLLEEFGRHGTVDEAKVIAACEHANEAVRGLGSEAITTLIVAVVAEGMVRTWHCGDSTALLMGQRGRHKLRTIDHTPPGLRAAEGLISLDDVHRDPERHLLVAALGIEPLQLEATGPAPLGVRDTLVVASDGLFDNLYDDRIVETLRTGKIEASTWDLVRAAREHMQPREMNARPGKPDDLSALVYRTRG